MSKIEICAVGGYDEVGRNMTAVKVDDDVLILDMGVYLEKYIRLTEDDDLIKLDGKQLIREGASPNIKAIKKWQHKVRAIIPTHAHLDHIGSIPFLSDRYEAEILGTPYTTAVLNAILKDEKIKLKNPIKTVNSNSMYMINSDLRVEFIHVTHSTPQTAMIAIHTKKGVIIYANDFKFDLYPILGKKPNFDRLRELGKKGVLALICDSTYSRTPGKTASESVAKDMLRDVMLGTDSKGKAVVISTFSSHIARLKSIIEFGKKMNRKIVFLGRSLSKYVKAAESIALVDFSSEADITPYGNRIKRKLKKIMADGKHKYLLVVTGHQGEPQSTLYKMLNEKFEFRFSPGDHMIFSCKTIPTPTNIKNREYLEKQLKKAGVRLFKEIHVSGHAAREDLYDLVDMLKPKHIIPAHGSYELRQGMKKLAKELGYKSRRTLHMLNNGDFLKIS